MASGFGRGEEPPLDLVQTLMGTTVVPVAVRAKGPIGTGLAGWRVLVGAPIVADPSIPLGDPLGAAELSEHVRATIEMLT